MRSSGKDGMKIKRAEGDVEGRQMRPKPQPPNPFYCLFASPLLVNSKSAATIITNPLPPPAEQQQQTHPPQHSLHTDGFALVTVARKSTGGAGKQGTWK